MSGSTTTGLPSSKRIRSAAMFVAALLAAPVMGGVAVAGASTPAPQAAASTPEQAPTPSADSVDTPNSSVETFRHNRRYRCYRDRWGNRRCHLPCRNRYRCGNWRHDRDYDRWDDDDRYDGRVGGHRDRDDDDNDDNDRMYDDSNR